ncbi:MAG: hypothetical protein D6772_01440, partial [Bacteroidetes bacterium]
GSADFDLSIVSNIYLFGNDGWSVSFHFTEADAEDNVGAITDNILTFSSNQTIYARVANANGCPGVARVRLSIEDPPEAAPALLTRCDEGGAQASFDLTEAISTIDINGVGQEVVFFRDQAAGPFDVIIGGDRTNFVSPTTSVWAQVLSPNLCRSELVEVELFVITLDPSDFSLEVFPDTACGAAQVELIVNTPGGPPGDYTFNVSYGPESDFPARTENLFGSSGSTILNVEASESYLFMINSVISPLPSACPLFFETPPIALVTILEGPPAFDARLSACEFENGEALFDLTTLNDSITRGQDFIEVVFYEDEFLFDRITNPLEYRSRPRFVYAVFEDPAGCFSQTAEIQLFVDTAPAPIDFALDRRDHCGPTVANLSFTMPPDLLLDYNFTLRTASASRDTTLENISRDSLIGLFVSDTTIFTLASVTNENGCTFPFEMPPMDTINIRPADLVATATTLELCDQSADNSRQATFNLTTAEATIRGTSTAPVRWFEDEGLSMPITNTTSFSVTNSRRVFAILNGPCPSAPVPIDLRVNPNPMLSISVEAPRTCAIAADAVLVAISSGGADPLTYDWSNDAWDGLSRVTGVESGAYQLTVIDDNACRAAASVRVTPAPLPDLSCSVLANVSVAGGSDGQASYTLASGTPPYTYQLNGPSSQSGNHTTAGMYTLDNLSAGEYTLIVTDSRRCRAACNFTISEPGCDLSLAISGSNLSCNGAEDGSIDLSISSSFPITDIDWNVDAYDGIEDPQSLAAANYTVRVTDANSCTANTSITITQPPVLMVDCSNTTNASATGVADGSLAAAVSGGTAPYDLVWSGPLSGSRNDDPDGATPIMGLSAGSYSLDIIDANGCATRCDFSINEPGCNLTLSCSPNGMGQGDGPGSVTYTIAGGTAPYRVERSGPASEVIDALGTAGPQSTGLIPTGDYQIVITDANGCTAQCSFRNVNCDLSLTCTPNGMGQGNGPGSYTFTFSGGTPGYSLELSGPDNFTDTRTDTAPYNSPVLAAGDWTFTLMDADGCSQVCSFTVALNCELIVDLEPTDPNCPQSSDGAINVALRNGTPPYVFDWSDDQYDSNGPAAMLTGLAAATYMVTVTDANGCEASASVTLSDPPAYQNSCNGEVFPSSPTATDGVIVVEILAGPAGPYTISYDNGAGASGSQVVSAGIHRITGLANGSYTITISSAAACTTNCQVDLFFVDCTFEISRSVSAESCAGAADGVIMIEPATGTPPYTYNWSDAGAGSMRTNLAPGDYTVTITDANTCALVTSFTINPGRALPTVSFGNGGTICPEDCIDLDMSLTGMPGFNLAYDWVFTGQRLAADFSTNELNPSLSICPAQQGVPAGDFFLRFHSLSDDRCSQELADTVRFTYLAPAIATLSPELCLSDSLVVNGAVFTADNPNGQVIIPGVAQSGCDSIVNVALRFFEPVSTDIMPQICAGGSISIGGTTFDESNPTGSVVLRTVNGCDSTVNVSLQVVDVVTTNLQPVLCPGDSLMVGDSTLRAPGNYAILFPQAAVSGCDSLVNVDLSFFPPATGSLLATLCPGESRTVGTQVFDENRPSGDVLLPGASVQGCDSLVRVQLNFFANDTTRVEPLLCLGESITIGNETFDESRPDGFVVLANATMNGCDSLLRVALRFRPQPVGALDTVLCAAGSIQLGGTVFDADNPSGQVVLSGASVAGCDSLVNVSTSYVTELRVSMPPDTLVCGNDPVNIAVNLGAGGVYDLSFSRSGGGTFTETGVNPPSLNLDLGVFTQ